MKTQLLEPYEVESAGKLISNILHQLKAVVLGHEDTHKMVLISLLSRGHLLLEGVPGVGKTLLVRTLSKIMGLEFKRVQFTPDLMPGDILGAHILQTGENGKREMEFHKGPVFTNILLADEINRATPKTQAALLEAMQENCVTLLGKTFALPSPFFVLATQNPIELEGTYPLPEAQVDRFLVKLTIKTIDSSVMTDLITTRRRGEPPDVTWTISKKELSVLFEYMDKIFLPKPVGGYISRLVAATWPNREKTPGIVDDYVSFGASPRAAIGISEAARAHALMDGRPTAGFDDVKKVAVPVLNHRIILNYKAGIDNINSANIVEELISQIPDTDVELPNEISIKQEK